MRRLFIDIEKCYKCKECKAQCNYFYHQTDILKTPIENKGIEKLLAKVSQYIICRRCEEKFCVTSCPNNALEKDERGILQRHLFRCTSCKSCTIACPFGTIYPEIVSYKTSECDYCVNKADVKLPLCVETCPEKALEFVEIGESVEKNIYLLDEHLAVHGLPWNKEAKVGVPK